MRFVSAFLEKSATVPSFFIFGNVTTAKPLSDLDTTNVNAYTGRIKVSMLCATPYNKKKYTTHVMIANAPAWESFRISIRRSSGLQELSASAVSSIPSR